MKQRVVTLMVLLLIMLPISFAQTSLGYNLVFEMRDGTRRVAPIAKEWSSIYELPHFQSFRDMNSDGTLEPIIDVTWGNGRFQVKPADVKRMYTEPVQMGDVNGDDAVNIIDVVTIIGYKSGSWNGNFNFIAADINGNGELDEEDIKKIVEIIMGNEKEK